MCTGALVTKTFTDGANNLERWLITISVELLTHTLVVILNCKRHIVLGGRV
jgi:hypothetical protein